MKNMADALVELARIYNERIDSISKDVNAGHISGDVAFHYLIEIRYTLRQLNDSPVFAGYTSALEEVLKRVEFCTRRYL